MKTAVAYYSLGGTTRSYARAEAKARNADLIELTPKTPYNRFTAFVRGCLEAVKQKAVALDGMPLFVGYDRVVLMAPVWAGYPAPPFNSAVELLPPGTEVEVILVSGSGNSEKRRCVCRSKNAAVRSRRSVTSGPADERKGYAMKGYTYVLRCADDTLYCGWTNDLTARLAAHNSGKGAKYTRGRGPVTLVYSEMFDTQSEAMQREAAIKKLTRPQKQALIDSQNGGELLTVYDADGRACGERPRAVVHAQGLSHHVCHLWVVGERNGVCGLWLQQRQFDRPLFPGGFDLTSTGHIDPGETPLTGVLREAREESGLQLTAADLIDGGSYRQRYSRGEVGFDDELAYTFLARIDGIPPFRPGPEVAEMLFVPLADFAAAQEQGASLTGLTPDGRTMEMQNESLCCLHTEEWQGAKPRIEALFD